MFVDLNERHRIWPQVCRRATNVSQWVDGVDHPRDTARLFRQRRRPRRAFTLIELLVVISIIVLLIAILLPSLSRAREQAKLVACSSNLKQIGIAERMYAGDWNGVLPRYYDTIAPPAGPDAGTWSTNAVWTSKVGATGLPGWQGLGLTYSYMSNKLVYFCPDDTLFTGYEKYDWNNFPNALPNPATSSAAGSYCVRGWSMPDNNTWGAAYACGTDPLGQPGKTVISVGDRPWVSCFFMGFNSGAASRPALFHQMLNVYPILYGDGHVVPVPKPSWFDVNLPQDAMNQYAGPNEFWISMDKAP